MKIFMKIMFAQITRPEQYLIHRDGAPIAERCQCFGLTNCAQPTAFIEWTSLLLIPSAHTAQILFRFLGGRLAAFKTALIARRF